MYPGSPPFIIGAVEFEERKFGGEGSSEMARLLHASVELNTWAGALNMFALWAVSAGVAALILAVCSGNARQVLTGGD
jgi:hypothetical protein